MAEAILNDDIVTPFRSDDVTMESGLTTIDTTLMNTTVC